MYMHKIPIFTVKTNDSSSLRNWVEYPYSLTDRLKDALGHAQLEIISQKWMNPTWWDKYLLKINDQLIFQREILMKHQESTYWYARTIIPEQCYNVSPDFFNRLKKESIRDLIFDNNLVTRTNMTSYSINNQCIELCWAKKHIKDIHHPLWVRLAEYSFLGKGVFFLVELLLPELENVW